MSVKIVGRHDKCGSIVKVIEGKTECNLCGEIKSLDVSDFDSFVQCPVCAHMYLDRTEYDEEYPYDDDDQMYDDETSIVDCPYCGGDVDKGFVIKESYCNMREGVQSKLDHQLILGVVKVWHPQSIVITVHDKTCSVDGVPYFSGRDILTDSQIHEILQLISFESKNFRGMVITVMCSCGDEKDEK